MARRRTITVGLVSAAALVVAATALAIGNGVPDGNAHPNVGMLAIDFEGAKYGVCSGSYAGPRKDAATSGVFLTAAHCVDWMQAEGISGSDLRVTFDTTATFDDETGEVLGATTWYEGASFAFHPEFGQDESNPKDLGVVVLATAPSLTPVGLPSAGLLDRMAAQGGMRPGAIFDNVGYGYVPTHKGGPPRFDPPPGRMLSTSKFQGLTKAWLKLLMTSDTRGGENGGVCFGDSGSPHFVEGTNTVVAITSGGDPNCRARSNSQRLDTADARAFLGQYLNLP